MSAADQWAVYYRAKGEVAETHYSTEDTLESATEAAKRISTLDNRVAVYQMRRVRQFTDHRCPQCNGAGKYTYIDYDDCP